MIDLCPCCDELCEIECKKDEIPVYVDEYDTHLTRYLHYSYCHGCGSEFANTEQARNNLDEPLRR